MATAQPISADSVINQAPLSLLRMSSAIAFSAGSSESGGRISGKYLITDRGNKAALLARRHRIVDRLCFRRRRRPLGSGWSRMRVEVVPESAKISASIHITIEINEVHIAKVR